DGVNGNLKMVAMCLFYSRRKLRHRKVLIGRDLDDIHVLENILPDGGACQVGAVDEQKFLIEDRVRERRIEALKIVTARDQLAPGREESGTRNTACIDGVAQFSVAVNSGMSKIANSCDAALQIFPSHLRPHQHSFARRFDNR